MLHTLNVAQTGLKTSQTQVENVMNNIANENVAGYKKRVVDVSELGHADARITGRGITIDSISRTTQVYMYQNLIEESSRLYDLKELNSQLSDIESMFKETDDAGLSVDLNNYFKSVENLRTTPHSEIYKNDIVNNANNVILELNKIYSSIERKEESILTNTKEIVDKVNSILKEIGSISEKILKDNYGSPNDLLDKRDALEKELSQYVDVEISRNEHYQLNIGGSVAVRFSTNIHELELVENYLPQQDVYAATNANGDTLSTGINNDFVSSFTVDGNPAQAEVQTLDITGTVDSNGEITFLGTTLTGLVGADSSTVATEIYNNRVAIIQNWNNNNPDKEIANTPAGAGIADPAGGNTLTLTYEDTEGDMPALANTSSNGIDFTGSLESSKGLVDSLTYTINGKDSIRVAIGEVITDVNGAAVDFDQSGGGGVITENNIIQALVYQINKHGDYNDVVTAYNGKYETNDNGAIIKTSNSNHSKYQDPTTAAPTNPNNPGYADRYLFIEARHSGKDGQFVGELLVNEASATQNKRTFVDKNEYVSQDATNDIHLEIYEKEVKISAGALRPMIDNINSTSNNNLLNGYKEKLDQFARNLVNMTESYIENSDYSYTYGNKAVNESYDADKAVNINLFSGVSVKTLEFNETSLNVMTQEKLDYLADLQWKEDIDFDGTGMYLQSFTEFYQTLRVSVADDREGIIFREQAQEAVTESLQTNYENIVKVDKDEELVELIKFQKAYEANAKIITVIDEMISTLLGLKR